MLYILLSLIVFIPVFSGFGSVVERIFGNFYSGISSKIILGIFAICILQVSIAFFLPLNIYVELSTIILGIGLFFYFQLWKELWDFIKMNYNFFLIFTFIILLFGSFYPFILDHFGYYVPTIKWISEIGSVKGISNLDFLIGQMSFWHFLQAGFSNFTDIYLRLNTCLMVFYLIYILEKKSWIHFLFFPILLLFTQSPSPDLAGFVISLIILNEILTNNKNSTLLFALSVFVFAIKPTMMALPIFTLLYSIFILKSNLKFIILGSIIFILYRIKNQYTFGLPMFPFSLLDYNLPWRPNSELLKISSETAIQKTYDMQYSVAQISNFSTLDYITNWLLLDGIKSFINVSFILIIIIFSIFTFKIKSKIIYFLWISIMIKSILILLISAQCRFLIDVFLVIFFVLFYQTFHKKTIFITTLILTSFSFLILSVPQLLQRYVPSFNLGHFMSGFSKHQFLKPACFELNKYKTYQIGNLTFNIVQNYPFSFDTKLPAISPYYLHQYLDAGIFPQKIGKDLKEGFINKKLTDKEKYMLKKIIETKDVK